MNQILRRQTSRSHYGSKVPAVTVTVFKWSCFCIIKVKGQEQFVFRFRLSFEKCSFLKNEIQFDKFDRSHIKLDYWTKIQKWMTSIDVEMTVFGNVIFQCKWLVFTSIKQWPWPKVIPIYVIMTFIYVSLYFVYIYCSLQGSKSKHTRFAQHRYFFVSLYFVSP